MDTVGFSEDAIHFLLQLLPADHLAEGLGFVPFVLLEFIDHFASLSEFVPELVECFVVAITYLFDLVADVWVRGAVPFSLAELAVDMSRYLSLRMSWLFSLTSARRLRH